MEKINRGLFWGIIASESIHIFCCALPTLFSVLSLLAGMGMIATMPGFIDQTHDIIHSYEIPMIITSGVILVLGWGLYIYSRKISCRTQGTCSHSPCGPKKDRTKAFMIVATVLFIVNVTVYFTFHRAVNLHEIGVEIHYDHDHGHGHDHH